MRHGSECRPAPVQHGGRIGPVDNRPTRRETWPKRALMSFLLLALLAACDSRPNTWTAFVYPSDRLLYGEIIRTGLRSEAECREVARQTMVDLDRLRPDSPTSDSPSFECGYRCAFRADWRVHGCAKTVDQPRAREGPLQAGQDQ